MAQSVTTALRRSLSATFLPLYGLAVTGLLVAGLGLSLWASRFPRYYFSDVEYGAFVAAIVPWAVVAAAGLFLALCGLVAIITEATGHSDGR